MTPSNLPNKLPSLGSLTGFVTNISDDNSDLTQTGFSIAQLMKFLTNEGDQNFITREWALLVNKIIQDHMADTTNPHNVTLDQITPSFVNDVLGRMIPGSPPVTDPVFALDPDVDLPFADMIPATHTLTNCLRLTSAQNFNVANGKITSDYLTGQAGWALYSNLVNVLNNNWMTAQDPALNGVITQTEHPTVVWDFPFWSVAERKTIGEFGLSLPTSTTVDNTYSVQLLVKSIAGGTLTVYNKDEPSKSVTFDLGTGLIIKNNSGVKLTIIPQIENIYLLCFSFTAAASQTTIRLVHKNTDQTNEVREGNDNRLLFLISQPLAVQGAGIVPLPANANQPWGSSALTLNTNRVNLPERLTEFMINIHFYLQPGSGSTQLDTVLFKMGIVTLTRTSTEWQLKLAGIAIQSRPILDGLNIFTLSYSADKLIIKSLQDDRREYKGTYPAVQTGSVTIGPCGGYLLGFYLYSQADHSRTVEFLNDA